MLEGVKLPNGGTLSVIINRFLVAELKKYNGPDPYIDGIILRITDNIGVVDVEHHARRYGRSGYSFRQLFSLGSKMILTYSLIPIRLIGFIGFVMLASGIGYGFYKAFDQYGPPGGLTNYELLFTDNVFSRGLLLLALGLVGEYIGRTYLLLTKDPQFIVRRLYRAQPAKRTPAPLQKKETEKHHASGREA